MWRPVYSDGTRVRFANRPADLEGPDQAWTQPRVLYVHHPSDPVGNWRPDSLWRRPEWTEAPRGYDIPARPGWFPIVTGVQEVADLIAGFSAPSGYGHNYAIDFVSGWAPSSHRCGGRRPTAPGSSGTSPPSEPPRRGRSSVSGHREATAAATGSPRPAHPPPPPPPLPPPPTQLLPPLLSHLSSPHPTPSNRPVIPMPPSGRQDGAVAGCGRGR